jgi:fused signal recognition particle receptor
MPLAPLLPLLGDLLNPTTPELIGEIAAAVAVLATGAYVALRRKKPTEAPPEEPGERAGPTAEASPKTRRAIDVARSTVAAPKEKPSGVAARPGMNEAAIQAEAEARRAEEEALKLAAARKKAEEDARRAEEAAKRAEAEVIRIDEARRRAEDAKAKAQAAAAAAEATPATPAPAGALEAKAEAELAAAKALEAEAQKLRQAADEAKRAADEARKTEDAARKKAADARALAKEELSRAKSFAEGLEKTRNTGFVAKIGDLFRGKKQVDQTLLDQVEEVLFTSDIGAKTVQKLIASISEDLSHKELKDEGEVFAALRRKSREILSLPGGPFDLARAKGEPFVLMVVGVNGVGKTTTIGKLASRFVAEDKTVILAAGDTFRAAATEQLEVWGERTACEVVKGKEGSDPSAVVFNAIKRAREVGADVVIADTAGRLHTKSNLMEELKKVKRVANKALEGAPHEVILVLDATMGQNAIAQARHFTSEHDVTGIVLTKLDGTAKGGVILGICDELKLPVRFIGIGEKVGDMRLFEPIEFVEALFRRA